MGFIPPDIDLIGIKKGLSEKVLKELWEECFARNGNVYLRVISGSMVPLIAVDDRVLVQEVSAKDIKIGNIILFKGEDVLVIHRVVGKFNEDGKLYFIQKGDLSGSAGKVSAEHVIGKVIAVEKKGRILKLDQGWGWVADVLLGMNNYVSYQTGTRLNHIREGLRDVPGFKYLKGLYRAFVLPLNLFNRGTMRILSNLLSG